MRAHKLDIIEAQTDDLTVDNESITSFNSLKTNKNMIINGDFDIWQRGISSAVNGYGCSDRWINGVVGGSLTQSQVTFTAGQTDVPNYPTYHTNCVVTSAAGATNYITLVHRIENLRRTGGQTVTLSFWAKANASKNMAIELVQDFGDGGTADLNGIGSQKFALTTSWTKIEHTISVPSLSGKTLGPGNNLAIVLWFDGGSSFDARTDSLGHQSGTFDISQVQLEKGADATYFEIRPIAEELALCQRYFEKSYADATFPGAITYIGSIYHVLSNNLVNGGGWGDLIFCVRKRAAPTVTAYSPTTGASGKCFNQTAGADRSAGAYQPTNSGFVFYYSDAIGSTDQHVMWMQWTADAEL